MNPVVRYMLLCRDARPDILNPLNTHIDGLLTTIVSEKEPPFPVRHDVLCVFLVLAGCRGQGTGQVRVVMADAADQPEVFGSPVHRLDFSGHSPLDTLGVTFRLTDCPFPQPGVYGVQFWYNGVQIEERLLRLR